MKAFNLLRNVALLVFVALIAAGCASSSKKGGGDGAADGSGSSGYGVGGGVDENTVVVQDVDDGSIGTVFYFDFDKSELRADVRAELQRQASMLQNKTGVVRLEGHCDERGTREYNMALGERRAKAVANYLASLGVPSSQIEPVSYGEEKPAAMGHDEQAWTLNRRVELIYIE